MNSQGITLALIGLLLTGATRAHAQQVCYAHDSAGRLTGVIDQHDNGAFYDYDAVGNILSIRRVSPSGPVTIYAVYPASGAPGEQFEIFGVGLGSAPDQHEVTVGGVPATVAAVLPCTLVVDVPPNGVTGAVRVTTPLGEATSAESFLVSRFAIAGTAFSVLPNTTVEYAVVSNGCNDPAVVWRVNGVAGGDATVGIITSSGVYTSPPAIPTPAFVVIRAESIACPTLFDEKTLNLVTSSTTFVYTAASAAFGAPPVSLPAQVVVASASARVGDAPLVLPPSVVLGRASAANVPVITGVAPASRSRLSSFQITIAGVEFTGATGLTFFGTSTPDAAITVSNVSVNAGGTSLTANVTIASTAAVGARTIRVDRPGGNSTAVPTSANVFTVTP